MNQLQFLRALVVLNGAVPLMMLLWDAYRGQLGANSVNNALHITGILSLVFLFLSLLMSPPKWATGWGGCCPCDGEWSMRRSKRWQS